MFQPVVHVRTTEANGAVRAITVFDRAPLGVLVIAGVLRADRRTKPVGELGSDDHEDAEVISLATLEHVYEYFTAPEYLGLVRQLRSATAGATSNPRGDAFPDDEILPAFAVEPPRLFDGG